MALASGNAACTTGLSATIYNYLTGDSTAGLSASPTAAQPAALKALCYNLALAVVTHIQAHAEVSITVPIDAFGAGIPAAPVTLTGTIS